MRTGGYDDDFVSELMPIARTESQEIKGRASHVLNDYKDDHDDDKVAVIVSRLMTWDKVLSEGCESRNNHRYAVVVQDVATQCFQSYPCKTKTSQETERSLRKFLEPTRKPKVIYTDNSLEFGKSCEVFSWNHCTSTPHRSETNGIAERAVRRVKEGTSAVKLQSGLDEKWWADSMNVTAICEIFKDLLSDGENTLQKALRRTISGTDNSIWFFV